MTQPFPDHMFLTGQSAPSGIECDAPDLRRGFIDEYEIAGHGGSLDGDDSGPIDVDAGLAPCRVGRLAGEDTLAASLAPETPSWIELLGELPASAGEGCLRLTASEVGWNSRFRSSCRYCWWA